MKPTLLNLDEDTRQKLSDAGKGNMSAGCRRIVAAHDDGEAARRARREKREILQVLGVYEYLTHEETLSILKKRLAENLVS